jgi:SNF2 family DNA or RNA helicase
MGIDIITELLDDGKPVLVWSLFVKTIRKIEKTLSAKGYRVRIIDGSVPLDEREKIIKEFKENLVDVIVTNPNTMAESVSLHTVCHDAVYFEYNFNLTHMLQSRDRINRLGLPDNQYTRYYYLMLDSHHVRYNSIDQKIYDRLKVKEAVMLDAIEGNTLKRVDFNDLDDIMSILEEELA